MAKNTAAKSAVKTQQTQTKVSYLDQEQQLARQAGAITQAELAAKQAGTVGEKNITLADIAAQQAELGSQKGDTTQLSQLQLQSEAAQRGEYGAEVADIKGQEPEKIKQSNSAFASRGAFWSGATRTAEKDIKRADAIAIRGIQLQISQSQRRTQTINIQTKAQLRGIDSQITALTRKAQLTTLKADEQVKLDQLQAQKDNIQLQEHLATIQEEQRQATLQDALYQAQLTQGKNVLGSDGGKSLSVGELNSAFRTGVISGDQYVGALESQGYSEAQSLALYNTQQRLGPEGQAAKEQAKQGEGDKVFGANTFVNGQDISANRGAQITEGKRSEIDARQGYQTLKSEIGNYLSEQTSPPATLSGLMTYLRGVLRNQKVKDPDSYLAQYAHYVSLALYELQYGQ